MRTSEDEAPADAGERLSQKLPKMWLPEISV